MAARKEGRPDGNGNVLQGTFELQLKANKGRSPDGRMFSSTTLREFFRKTPEFNVAMEEGGKIMKGEEGRDMESWEPDFKRGIFESLGYTWYRNEVQMRAEGSGDKAVLLDPGITEEVCRKIGMDEVDMPQGLIVGADDKIRGFVYYMVGSVLGRSFERQLADRDILFSKNPSLFDPTARELIVVAPEQPRFLKVDDTRMGAQIVRAPINERELGSFTMELLMEAERLPKEEAQQEN